jgi:hypothetical protein
MGVTQEKDLLLKIRDPGVSDEEAVSIASAFFNKHAPSGSATRTFFHHMFMRICKNRLRPSHVCNKPLADLTTSDGVTIGASLSSCLFSNTEGNTGVEEWVSNFPALQELDKEYVVRVRQRATKSEAAQEDHRGYQDKAITAAAEAGYRRGWRGARARRGRLVPRHARAK